MLMNEITPKRKKTNSIDQGPTFGDIINKLEAGEMDLADVPERHRVMADLFVQHGLLDPVELSKRQSPVAGIKDSHALTKFLVKNPGVQQSLRDAGAIDEDAQQASKIERIRRAVDSLQMTQVEPGTIQKKIGQTTVDDRYLQGLQPQQLDAEVKRWEDLAARQNAGGPAVGGTNKLTPQQQAAAASQSSQFEEADEPKRKAADKTKAPDTEVADKPDVDLGKMFEPKANQPMAKVDPPKGKTDDTKSSVEPELKKASAAKTAAAMGRMTPTDQMRDMLGRINVPDELVAQEPDLPTDTSEVEPTPPPPASVPALISKAIAADDPNAVDPEFHQVKNLPGYLSKAIRAMGRETFRQYTSLPLEDVSVIAHMGGQGPNSERELTTVAQWLKTNARKIDQAEMDYGQTIPGYQARTAMYSTKGMRFLVVQDFAGGYIYAWPEGSAGDELEGPDDGIKALMSRYGV